MATNNVPRHFYSSRPFPLNTRIRTSFKKMLRVLLGVILQVVYYMCYYSMNTIFCHIRNIFWWLNGTSAALANACKSENYHRSAQVLSIITRGKLDNIGCRNSVGDFMCFHDRFDHPQIVCKQEVTLYHVTQDIAVFVKFPDGALPWNVDKYGFSRTEQFKMAEKVIIMPMSSACRLAQEIGSPKGYIIFLNITARCGSTLMCSMFNKIGCCITYSEPSVIADLTYMLGARMDSRAAELVNTTLALLCKSPGKDVTHFIKLQPQDSLLLPLLTRLYPSASFLFLYRDIRKVISSLIRAGVKSPLSIVYAAIELFSKNAATKYIEYHLYDKYQFIYGRGKETSRRATSTDASVAEFHLGATKSYLDIYNENPKRIAAIRYEDLVRAPERFLQMVFDYCHLDTALVPLALKALEVDSQKNSYLNKDGLSGFTFPPVPSDIGREEIAFICDLLGLPHMLDEENIILPGTLIP